MVKSLWYLFSLLTIFLILINVPSKNSVSSSINQNQLFSFQSNQLLMQKLIIFNVSMFFLLTVLLLIIF
uniref:Preprotein-translocase subunit g n=1 Tax=Rhodomela confervoides TaxID=35163 RepID=A0A1Z1MAE1_RHOCN|nr:preprotein-translocase subunit g [Rhodomela confervoides]ARW62714.1 preprotein-translocase subunit g [Rhodomela confervoides]